MKKRMALLLVVLAMMLTVPAFAVQMRSAGVYPHLSFNGTTATCVVTVEGENSTDRIEVDVELWEGGVRKNTWSASGTEYIEFVRTAGVTSGRTYTLKAYATVNDRDLPMSYVTKRCP